MIASGCGSDGTIGVASGQEPDPVAIDFPIAYTKRAVPTDDSGMLEWDTRDLTSFTPGAALFIRDRASPSAPEQQLTPAADDMLWDIRDLQVSYDAQKLVFSMRGPFIEDADEDEQPSWNIWEYDVASASLTRVIESELTAEAGHDRMPHYLPDGRIVFSSTRQRRTAAVLLDEGRPQYAAQTEDDREDAFVLHVMTADGADIRQISFNQSHDLYPSVLPDGAIVFSRWENTLGRNGIHLYRLRPDGTEMSLLYGANSHNSGTDGDTVQFTRALSLPGGELLAVLAPFEPTEFGGDLVAINVEQFLEFDQSIAEAGQPGPGQVTASINDVRTDQQPSPGGRYTGGWPVWDDTGRVLVNWTQCRLSQNDQILPCTEQNLADPGTTAAMPLYGAWIYDPASETQLPVVVPNEGEMVAEAIAARPRPRPPVLFDQTPATGFDPVLADRKVGLLDIRSVYDLTGNDTANPDIATVADPAQTTADQRAARFMRVSRRVPQPDDEVRDVPGTAFGRNRSLGMREIVGYAPIEPDGSVRIEVPADLPLSLEVLDRRGRRTSSRHRNWLQVRPGETVQCVGCHAANTGLSHGRPGAFDSVWPGAATTGLPFPNTRPALFADYGETMAQLRSRISCQTDCAAQKASVDLQYEDVWTDEDTAGRPPDSPFAYRYADLDTPLPVADTCLTSWSAGCRAIINYEQHVHPLWSYGRQVFDIDEVTLLADNTCNTCHSTADADGAVQVPAAQLDLSDGISPDQADHFNAYRELLFNDNEQEIVMDALQDRLVEIGIDPETNEPILVTVNVSPAVSAGRALSSGDFINIFLPGGSHAGRLSDAELRLITEWIDIGAQYYNDPFAAPEN
ncbi:MAG: PD40 domain-containing protein [Gammaproteobacteria bacterium]|nr:PD40 domain-containing protein [Gammaproteobacteria bacterium]NNF66630.1 hypothetical protein [Gammaproteobacteria bacterium]